MSEAQEARRLLGPRLPPCAPAQPRARPQRRLGRSSEPGSAAARLGSPGPPQHRPPPPAWARRSEAGSLGWLWRAQTLLTRARRSHCSQLWGRTWSQGQCFYQALLQLRIQRQRYVWGTCMQNPQPARCKLAVFSAHDTTSATQTQRTGLAVTHGVPGVVRWAHSERSCHEQPRHNIQIFSLNRFPPSLPGYQAPLVP